MPKLYVIQFISAQIVYDSAVLRFICAPIVHDSAVVGLFVSRLYMIKLS